MVVETTPLTFEPSGTLPSETAGGCSTLNARKPGAKPRAFGL